MNTKTKRRLFCLISYFFALFVLPISIAVGAFKDTGPYRKVDAYNDKDLTLVGNIEATPSGEWNFNPHNGGWRLRINGDTNHFKLEHVYMVSGDWSDFRIIPWGGPWTNNMGFTELQRGTNQPGFKASSGSDNNIHITETGYFNIFLSYNTTDSNWVIDIYYDQSQLTELECQVWLDGKKVLDAQTQGFDFTFVYNDAVETTYSSLSTAKTLTNVNNYKQFFVKNWTCNSAYYLTDYRIGYTDHTEPYNSPGSTYKNYARAHWGTKNYIILYFVTAATHTNYYFYNGDGWSGDIYMYLGDGSLGSWPGTKMMAMADKKYTYSLTVGKSYSGKSVILVFNNNNGSQTSDLDTKGHGMYYWVQKSGFYNWLQEGAPYDKVLLKGDPNSWAGTPMIFNVDETGASFKGSISVSKNQNFKVNNLNNSAWFGWSEAVDYDNSARRKSQIVAGSSNNNIKANMTCSFDVYYTLSDQKLYIPSSLYNVTLNTNGGTISSGNVTEYYYGVGATLPNKSQISKSGKAFAGWYDNIVYHGNPITSISNTDSGDKVYYAKWDTLYTITLDNQSATSAGTTKIYEWQNNGYYSSNTGITKITTITIPTKTNYTFGGYYTGKNGAGTLIVNSSGNIVGSDTAFSSNATIYAKWTGNTYNITYKDQGNTTYSGNNLASLPATHTYGTATNLVVGTKSGYSFVGWYTNSSCTGNPITSIGATQITADTTLYAQWSANSYTVTFDNGGGTGGSISPSSYSVKASETSTITITAPTKVGFTPSYTITRTGDYGGDDPIVNGTTVTIPAGSYGTFAINTNWSGSVYTINLDNLDATTSGTTTIYEKYGTGYYSDSSATSVITSITIPTKVNSTGLEAVFGGYYTEQGGNGTQVIDAEGNIIASATSFFSTTALYAKWTVTFTFNPNASQGGSGTPFTRDVVLNGGYFKVPTKEGFTKLGYKLNKDNAWNANPDGSSTEIYLRNPGVEGYDGADMKEFYEEGANIFYANWASKEGDAAELAVMFNNEIGGICDDAGLNTNFADLKEAWDEWTNDLNENDAYWMNETRSSNTDILAMLAKYDYVLGKYGYGEGEDQLHDFLNRKPAVNSAARNFTPFDLLKSGDDNNITTVIVIITSAVALLSITALSALIVRKRKKSVD